MLIAYDCVLDRPGCAILQGSMGGDIDNYELALFGVGSWILAPTPNLKVYEINLEQLRRLQDRVSERLKVTHAST